MIKLHDDFCDTRFTIEIHLAPSYEIDADNLGDAIDILINLWESTEKDNTGYFLTDEEIADSNYMDEYVCGGNHYRATSFQWHEIRVTEVYK